LLGKYQVVSEIIAILALVSKIYLVRHGRQDFTASDCNLSPVGHKQAKNTAEYFRDKRIDYLVASPLKRVRQTAEHISEALGIPIITDDRLREVKIGWQNREQYDRDVRRALSERTWPAGVGGESAIAVGNRINESIQEHMQRGEAGLFVSSSFAMIQFLQNTSAGDLQKLKPELAAMHKQEVIRGLAHCSRTELDWDGSTYTIREIGATDHLEAVTFIESDIPLRTIESITFTPPEGTPSHFKEKR
jgi:broad specificity phosphatase PhoE